MSRVTDAFILFWDAQRRLCGDLFVGTHLFGWDWTPDDAGASASADSMVMVSASFFQEFYQPYLQRIGESFGGLAVHSCGDFSAVVPALCAMPTVKAVNAGQMTLPELCRAGVDARCLVIAWATPDNLAETFALLRTRNLRVDLTIGGIWPCTANGVKPLADWTPEELDAQRQFEERVLALAYQATGNMVVG